MKQISSLKSLLTLEKKLWPELKWFVTNSSVPTIIKKSMDKISIDSATAEDIAFLQYTSGSTSAPKVK